MARFVSIGGRWFPAKEYAVNPKAKRGEEPIYEGVDREAAKVLEKEGLEFLGRDARTEPDLIRASRELGFKSTDEYLKVIHGVDIKQLEKDQKVKLDLIHDTTVNEKEEKSYVNTVPKVNLRDQDGGFGDPEGVVGLEQRA